ncbi:hypothetical protein DID96_13655 [Burkholderia sp. Bp8963]|nr:hypothetical protein DID96_13655 [Burkholderia sp. Bp8963]
MRPEHGRKRQRTQACALAGATQCRIHYVGFRAIPRDSERAAKAESPVDYRKLNEATNGPDDNFRPPLSATVIGSGRAYFH